MIGTEGSQDSFSSTTTSPPERLVWTWLLYTISLFFLWFNLPPCPFLFIIFITLIFSSLLSHNLLPKVLGLSGTLNDIHRHCLPTWGQLSLSWWLCSALTGKYNNLCISAVWFRPLSSNIMITVILSSPVFLFLPSLFLTSPQLHFESLKDSLLIYECLALNILVEITGFAQ